MATKKGHYIWWHFLTGFCGPPFEKIAGPLFLLISVASPR
jgi:hypothetical protein